MLRNLFIISILIILILLIICELERNYIIPYNIYDFYIKKFPYQIGYSIYNFFFKYYSQKIVYNVSTKNFNIFLLNNHDKLLQEFNKNINLNLTIKAHKLSNMIKKNNNYTYIRFKYNHETYHDNLNHFPVIKKLITQYKYIKTCFFSIMKSKIIIPYHRGSTNLVLRYHYPLIVKDVNLCYLEVMGKKIYYDKPFAFDDTYPHMLVKSDNSLKVVLICDIDNRYIL